MPRETTRPLYLSAMQRALLTCAAEEKLAALVTEDGARIVNVGWIGERHHEFRPLGVRMAIAAGYLRIEPKEQTPEALKPWRRLLLTDAGVAVLSAAVQSKKPPKRRSA